MWWVAAGGVKREARGALAEAFVAYLKALPASSLESADNLALVLTSVLALDDAHPFRAQVVATLGTNSLSLSRSRMCSTTDACVRYAVCAIMVSCRGGLGKGARVGRGGTG